MPDWILWTVALCMWYVTGLTLLAVIDQDGRILDWITSAPYKILGLLAITLWPLVIWYYYRGT